MPELTSLQQMRKRYSALAMRAAMLREKVEAIHGAILIARGGDSHAAQNFLTSDHGESMMATARDATLPTFNMIERTMNSDSALATPASTPSLRILIVENHRDTLRCLEAYFRSSGYAVDTARRLDDALAFLRNHECDILFSDIGLPDGDGWDLLRQAENRKPKFAVSMSGFGRAEDYAKSKAAGYRHHLVKPFLPDDLDQLIAEAVDQADGR